MPVQSSRQNWPVSPSSIGREQLPHIINNDDFVPRGVYTHFIMLFFWEKSEDTVYVMVLIWWECPNSKTPAWGPLKVWNIADMQSNDKWSRFSSVLRRPASNKCASINTVLQPFQKQMHIYMVGKQRSEDLRDLSARKDMLAAGVALRLPPHFLPLRWSRKPACKTLPHHSGQTPNEVNGLWIRHKIQSLYTRWQINCHRAVWESRKWPQTCQPHWETNEGPSTAWKRDKMAKTWQLFPQWNPKQAL